MKQNKIIKHIKVAYIFEHIITKEHDGKIKVEGKEGEGTKFTITLPLL